MADQDPADQEPYGKPTPLADPDSARFWESLTEHQLRIQRCSDCGAYRWPSREICHRCHSTEHQLERMSGEGRVVSWTLVHHATVSGFSAELPYCVGLIQLLDAPDVVLIGAIGVEPSMLAVGCRVEALFDDVTADLTLVRWIGSSLPETIEETTPTMRLAP